jgi:hypothetical protein
MKKLGVGKGNHLAEPYPAGDKPVTFLLAGTGVNSKEYKRPP